MWDKGYIPYEVSKIRETNEKSGKTRRAWQIRLAKAKVSKTDRQQFNHNLLD